MFEALSNLFSPSEQKNEDGITSAKKGVAAVIAAATGLCADLAEEYFGTKKAIDPEKVKDVAEKVEMSEGLQKISSQLALANGTAANSKKVTEALAVKNQSQSDTGKKSGLA